jgi:hypothetical protein
MLEEAQHTKALLCLDWIGKSLRIFYPLKLQGAYQGNT